MDIRTEIKRAGSWTWHHVYVTLSTPSLQQPGEILELQALLSEAREKARGAQERLSQERQSRRDDCQSSSQKLMQVPLPHTYIMH